MKPCSKNRKLIAWLALDALDPRQAADLRAHLETCDACSRYLEEISNAKDKLTAPRMRLRSDIRASEAFHRKVVGRLRAEEPQFSGRRLAAELRAILLNWRVALPLVSAAVVTIAVLSTFPPRSHPPLPVLSRPRVASAPKFNRELQPTIANYQRMANQSFERLDDLLTRQGNRNPAPARVYTASAFALDGASD